MSLEARKSGSYKVRIMLLLGSFSLVWSQLPIEFEPESKLESTFESKLDFKARAESCQQTMKLPNWMAADETQEARAREMCRWHLEICKKRA